MIKNFMPTDWPTTQEPLIWVKAASSGWGGNDRRSFRKTAGEQIAEIVKEAMSRRLPGEELLVVNAMGATEIEGPNRNGDGFRLATLEKYHPTFKSARWYRDHQTDDPKISYGIIKEATFDRHSGRVPVVVALNATKEAAERNNGRIANLELDDLEADRPIKVSMSCFPPGSMVRLADGSELPIEAMPIDTKVVTHHGNIGNVDQRIHREYSGDLVRFSSSGLFEDVVCTPDHRVWVRPTMKGKTPRCPVCCGQFKSLKAHLRQKLDPQHTAAYKDYARYAEGWYTADQISKGDYVRTPFSTEVSEEGDPLYAELLGYYLAEGYTFRHKKFKHQVDVDFTFSRHEQNLVDRVTELLTHFGFPNVKVYLKERNNVLLLRVTSPELGDMFDRDAGRMAWGKEIDSRIMVWSPATQMKLLGAFMDGDGCFNSIHKSLVGTTTSQRLGQQLAEICWRNGIPARLDRHVSKNPTKRPAYNVIVQASYVEQVPSRKVPEGFTPPAAKLQDISHLRHQTAGTVRLRKPVGLLAYVENGFVYRRVSSVSREDYVGLVYDLAVSVDDSFTVNGIAVHNCRVSHDVCSGCGNKAKRREDYCKAASCKHGGCSENLGRVSQDGHVLHTDNPDPNFFDLSRISTNQAGRTAFVYGRVKSASAQGLNMQTGHAWVGPLVKRLAEEEVAMSKRGNIYVPKFAGVTGPSPDYTSVNALVERSGILSGENWEAAFGVTLPNLFGIYTKLAAHPQLLDRVPSVAYQVPTQESRSWSLGQSIIPYVSGQQVKSAALAFLDGSRRAATDRSPTMTEEGLEYVAYQLASLHQNEKEPNAARTIIRNNFDLAS